MIKAQISLIAMCMIFFSLNGIRTHWYWYLSSDNTEEKEWVEIYDVVDIIENTIGPNYGANKDTETKWNDK